MNRFNKTVLRVCLTPFVFLPWGSAGADSTCGIDAPQVMIFPLESVVTDPNIELAGEVIGSCLSEIVWSFGEGQPETPIPASTPWDGTWSYGPVEIGLAEGVNEITVKADSAAGPGSATAIVEYNPAPPPPPPPPPPLGAKKIVDIKSKLTFYKADETDRLSVVAYLPISGENFVIPCDKKLTVRAYVLDPDANADVLAFEESIAAGGAGSCTDKRYRRVQSSSDLNEVVMQLLSPDRVYLYVFAWKGHYPLSVDKEAPGYLEYAATVPSFRIELEIGEGEETETWSGRSNGPDDDGDWIKLAPCDSLYPTIFGKKVEMRCNR